MHQHFKCFFGCYICNMGLQIIITYVPILKHHFQKLIQKHICTEKCKKREYMRMLKPSTSISLRHVQLCKTMSRRCIEATCNNIFFSITHNNIGLKTINWSHFRTLLSVTTFNIFALGGNAQNRITCKKKSVVMIMLPHCAVNFFNNIYIFSFLSLFF